MNEIIEKGKRKRKAGKLVLLCALTYFVSYITRVDLAAVLVAVQENDFASQQQAVLALTLTALAYGAGQLVSGWLGDRFDPRRVVLSGLAMTGICNLTAGAFGGISLVPLWTFNGLAQAFMWPPIVRILAAELNREDYNRAVILVNFGGLFGTISVYLLSPLIIRHAGIRFVFWIFGCVALLASVFWIFVSTRPMPGLKDVRPDAAVCDEIEGGKKKKALLFALILLAILVQGVLRDGVTNWTPTFISDSFGLDSTLSVLSGALLPLCGAAAYLLTGVLHKKLIRNELLCAAALFGLGALAAVLLRFAGGNSVLLSAFCLAVVAGSMHGVNLILICVIPPYFAKKGKVALISGLMNAFVYVGSASATWGIPLITGEFGKDGYLDLCLVSAVFGCFACALASAGWKKKKKEPDGSNG